MTVHVNRMIVTKETLNRTDTDVKIILIISLLFDNKVKEHNVNYFSMHGAIFTHMFRTLVHVNVGRHNSKIIEQSDT